MVSFSLGSVIVKSAYSIHLGSEWALTFSDSGFPDWASKINKIIPLHEDFAKKTDCFDLSPKKMKQLLSVKDVSNSEMKTLWFKTSDFSEAFYLLSFLTFKSFQLQKFSGVLISSLYGVRG